MATAEELTHSIAPGSMPYGERDDLEEGLSQIATGSDPLQAGAPGAPPVTAEGDLTPEDVLTNGEAVSELPITSGLSVGPGPGPFGGINATPEQVKLREVALTADSALVRHMATLALRRLYRQQQQE